MLLILFFTQEFSSSKDLLFILMGKFVLIGLLFLMMACFFLFDRGEIAATDGFGVNFR